ncbi:hypothetical protein MKK58_01400 [Methylobacterium sp. J-078]|jgi:hypothetical protein|uniref:Uncharacterized protein n=2 Tax=Methylobacterium TaxID=407 RepID=A0ABQ4U1W0_9HYPH|nr:MULTISPECIES: hypothetical protein [Methylobacterium]MCJ2043209.1 hypothetical protein [Methylobacterium sp. J-078]GJE60756.1 hypothetical protein MPOCJGCO_2872 [Methylobacterium trifolii]
MEIAVLTAATGLAGSLVGAASSLVTTWLTQNGARKAQWQAQEAGKREALYDEFIAEASKCLADAITHDPEGPEVVVGMFALIGRMRLRSTRPVIEAAERLLSQVVDIYASPNLTFAEIQDRIRQGKDADPLADFGETCRRELEVLRI